MQGEGIHGSVIVNYLLQTKEELCKAKAEYEALNAQLLDDLPKLYDLSMDILYNAIHLFLRLQYSFYAHAANQFSVLPLVIISKIFVFIFPFAAVVWMLGRVSDHRPI